jgi:hypothetical protein
MRRRGGWFWGAILLVVGLVFLLDNFQVLPGGAGRVIWPLAIILVGVWILWGALRRREPAAMEHVVVPLEGASQALIKVRHGAGRLNIHAGAGAGELINGDFAGGVDYRSRREGDRQEVKLRVPEDGFPTPWTWQGGVEWNFGVTSDVPVDLDCKLGANEAVLDLSQLRVTSLRLETGASKTTIAMPTGAGYTRAELHSGVGAVIVTIPAGVAARIHTTGGLSDVRVDTARFPSVGEKTYQSPDYAGAANRVDLEAETGVGSLEVQ